MNKLYYRPLVDGVAAKDDFVEFESGLYGSSVPQSYVIEEAAQHFYHNEDGWDEHWPIIFEIYDEDMKFMYSGLVELNSRPEFSCDETLYDLPDDYEGDEEE